MIKNLCRLLLRLDLLGHRINNLIVHVTSEYQILCKANEDIEDNDKGLALAQDDICFLPFADQVANEHHENKSKNKQSSYAAFKLHTLLNYDKVEHQSGEADQSISKVFCKLIDTVSY